MPTLFMMNVPHNCTESELADWVQFCGIRVKSVCLIRDLVAGVSPAFAYIDIADTSDVEQAVAALNGQIMRSRVITVSRARRAIPAA